jgi:hypothetical protein
MLPSVLVARPVHSSLRCVPGPFYEDKTAGVWCWPTSSAKVKESVELHLYVTPFPI